MRVCVSENILPRVPSAAVKLSIPPSSSSLKESQESET